MSGSMDAAARRIAELEQLVRGLRHDLNGALTPVLMMADLLRAEPDPRLQRAGHRIEQSVLRMTQQLKSTREVVTPKGTPTADSAAAPPPAAGGFQTAEQPH